MEATKHISGRTTEDIWGQIDTTDSSFLNNIVTIEQNGRETELTVTSSQGGSEEGGYETTVLNAPLHTTSNFRFAIYPQDFLTEVGKFFGMEDIISGYPEFDDRVIVNTNDELKVTKIFGNKEVRKTFQSLSGYSLAIEEDEEKNQAHLELIIQRAVTDLDELKDIYDSFYQVLQLTDPVPVKNTNSLLQ